MRIHGLVDGAKQSVDVEGAVAGLEVAGETAVLVVKRVAVQKLDTDLVRIVGVNVVQFYGVAKLVAVRKLNVVH